MLYRVKGPTNYDMLGKSITIPAYTKVIPATNLPEDSDIKYWAEPWFCMSEEEDSYMRNYGFGLTEDEVEEV